MVKLAPYYSQRGRAVHQNALGFGTGPLARACPRCDAQPGASCIRLRTGRVKGEDTGGGYTVRLKNPHAERKGPQRARGLYNGPAT